MSNKEEVQGEVQTLQDSVNKLKEQLKEQEKLDGLLKMTPLWAIFNLNKVV